eukprot:CFRG1702T1
MSLKQLVATRIMDQMIKQVQPANEWKVLVIDDHTTRIISSAVRMYDITDNGVTVVEQLSRVRQPLRHYEAIYFIQPTEESFRTVMSDFENSSNIKYAAIHLYTSSGCPEELFKTMAKSNAARYIKSFNELNIDFLANERQAFTLDRTLDFYTAFNNNDSSIFDAADIAKQLATVFVTLGENPYVCYASKAPRSEQLAVAMQSKLDELTNDGTIKQTGPRGQLVILDRTVDVVSPVLHELTYQAMAYDLLDIQNDVYTHETNTNKNAQTIIGEHDALWPDLRHKHIAETIDKVTSDFKEFQIQNKTKKVQGNEKVSMKELADALKAMPQHQEMMAKFTLHLGMAEKCMSLYDRLNLDAICNTEQDMAMGVTAEGQKIPNHIPAIVNILSNTSADTNSKLRLLMVYVTMKGGISEGDLSKLTSQAGLGEADKEALFGMKNLGVRVLPSDRPPYMIPRIKRNTTEMYTTSRWTPVIKDVAEGLLIGKYDKSCISWVKGEPPSSGSSTVGGGPVSARSKPGWAKAKDKKEKADRKNATSDGLNSPRLVIYIIGGMSYSEIRAVYELTKKFNRSVLIGSDQRMVPELFLENMRLLNKTRSHAESNLQPQR